MPAPVGLKHLSYSSISCYQTCPRQWRYRYVLRPTGPTSPALIFGSAIHRVLQHELAARAKGEAAYMNRAELWNDWWTESIAEAESNGGIAWSDSTQDGLRRDGLTMIESPDVRDFAEEFHLMIDQGKPVIEKPVTLHHPDIPIPIIGFIDAIDASGIPHDFKTSARAWTQDRADKEEQPTYYLAALNQAGFPLNKGLLFRHVVLVKPNKAGRVQVQTLTTARNISDLFRLFETILQVWKGIVAESYPCNTRSWVCSPRWCSFYGLCQGVGT